MRFEGTLTRWNDERGFGFIAPDQGGDEIFVHVKSIANLSGRPAAGQRLSFEVEPGPQGRKRAKNVLPVRPARSITPQPRAQRGAGGTVQWGTATLFAIPAFLVLYVAVAWLWRPPGWLALAYLGLSVLTFATYAIDKAAAKGGAWRTPENTLHLLALAGGWPGALVAQQVLRHKSSKAEFRAVFWTTVVLNVVGFVALCSPLGRHLLPT
jgi:uncharacterized membrane protein YsdA (DUF1294 family)/cold shock CspA family protein